MRRLTPACRLALLAVFLAIPVLSGCANIAEEYVAADLATYQARAPHAIAAVRADQALTDEQKESALDTFRSWRIRIIRAGKKDVPDLVDGVR